MAESEGLRERREEGGGGRVAEVLLSSANLCKAVSIKDEKPGHIDVHQPLLHLRRILVMKIA